MSVDIKALSFSRMLILSMLEVERQVSLYSQTFNELKNIRIAANAVNLSSCSSPFTECQTVKSQQRMGILIYKELCTETWLAC